jgi:hypothetical protein
MDPLFRELFGVNFQTALSFFHQGLREATGKRSSDQMVYVASVLAHFSLTSRHSNNRPPFAGLGEVFDNFVFKSELSEDPEVLEIAGSQVILFAGFFRRQMRKRHSVSWYDDLGRSFFLRASTNTPSSKKRVLFESMAYSLTYWNKSCAKLHDISLQNRYVI